MLCATAEGDEASFTALFDRCKQQVYGYAMHFTRSEHSSEEIVQDVFLNLWVHRATLREVDRVEAYLYTVTRNRCFDHLKKLASERALKQGWALRMKRSEDTASERLLDHEYQRLLDRAMEQLPLQQKKIYRLIDLQGERQEQIAEYLHISRHTVKVHLAKARAAVRRYVAAHLDMAVLLIITFSFMAPF